MYIWEQSMPIPPVLGSLSPRRAWTAEDRLVVIKDVWAKRRPKTAAVFRTPKKLFVMENMIMFKRKWWYPCWGRHDCHFMPWHPSNFALQFDSRGLCFFRLWRWPGTETPEKMITGSSEFERVHLRSFHNFPQQPDMLQPTDKLQRIEINILFQPEKSCRFNDHNSDHNGDELSTSTQFAYWALNFALALS